MSDYRVSRQFGARFDSECSWCLGEISEGDQVAFIDDEIACKDCLEQARRGEAPGA